MHLEVTSLSPRDSYGMMLVTVSLTAKRDNDITDGGSIDVFIPATDSLAETRRLAILALRHLAQEILDAAPVENPKTDEEKAAQIETRVTTALSSQFPSQ